MKDLEVTMRVRNNRLKERRATLGMSQRKLAEAIGINLQGYGALESMRGTPFTSKGHWREIVSAIANFYEVEPAELFPATVLDVENPVIVRKFDESDAIALMTGHQERLLEGPEVIYERAELYGIVEVGLSILTKREEVVLRMRFGLDDGNEMTLQEIADDFEVTAERIRSIETKALRKLRKICEENRVGTVERAQAIAVREAEENRDRFTVKSEMKNEEVLLEAERIAFQQTVALWRSHFGECEKRDRLFPHFSRKGTNAVCPRIGRDPSDPTHPGSRDLLKRVIARLRKIDLNDEAGPRARERGWQDHNANLDPCSCAACLDWRTSAEEVKKCQMTT